jgi:outer membrane protein assembly factor BamB
VLPQDTDQLVCVDLGTGEDVWTADLHPYTGHVVVDGDTVLVGGWRGYTPLRALDTTTGRILWETKHCVHTVLPAAVDGGFLIGEPGGSLARLIGRRDMRELSTWLLPYPLVDHDNRVVFTAVGRDRFLARCGDHAVVEIVCSARTARELILAEQALAHSAPQYVGGVLWLRERGTGFTVADPRDGRLLWRVDLRQPLIGQVVPVDLESDAGFLLAGTMGTLFRLDADGQVTGRATVTRRIRALRHLAPGRVLATTKGTLLAAAVGD